MTRRTRQVLLGILAVLVVALVIDIARDPRGAAEALRQGFRAISGSRTPSP